jgi:hypothetical protein
MLAARGAANRHGLRFPGCIPAAGRSAAFSDTARRLHGHPVRMVSYLAPPLKAEAGFVLCAAV